MAGNSTVWRTGRMIRASCGMAGGRECSLAALCLLRCVWHGFTRPSELLHQDLRTRHPLSSSDRPIRSRLAEMRIRRSKRPCGISKRWMTASSEEKGTALSR